MTITHHLIRKVIVIFVLLVLVDVSLQQTWAKPVSRGPSSVESGEDLESDEDENEESPADEHKPSSPSSERLGAPNKRGVQDLVIAGAMPIKVKQSFEDAFIELLNEGDSEMFDAGQPLTRDFDNAYVARQRVNHCSRFIQPDGTFGEWGEWIDTWLTQYPELRSALVASSAGNAAGMRSVCPRFSSLSAPQRREFWVWVMASLALFESTCGYDTSNPSNSNAVGIYQLHRSTTDRMPRAMIDSQRCGRMSAVDIAGPRDNILCTLDFIRDGFSGRMEHAPRGLITRAQQFQKLRTEDTPFVRLIKKFQLCRPLRQQPIT